MESKEAKAVIEALLFVSETPLTVKKLQKVLSPYPGPEIENCLAELEQDYNRLERGIQLVRVAGGYQLITRPQVSEWIKKLLESKENRGLSSPALETLAIIAYKQSITRPEIEAIRGVDSSGVLNSLLEKNLICIVGRCEGPGRPLLYATGDDFLLYFGLSDLNDLPKLEELAQEKENIG